MCGFCGYSGNNNTEHKQEIIQNMAEKIAHRGPDSSGFYVDEHVAFGFRRLSIIGLEDGSQPLYNEDKSLVLIFNGEIYNYKQLNEDLRQKGHTFSTKSDGECLLHLYEEYGTEMTEYLRGMFAFVIYNREQKKLFAVRDFFGIKPFYYTVIDDELLFASEIKSFLAHPAFKSILNEEALAQYLSFQYSVLSETFFQGVFKLQPGHFLIYDENGLSCTRYFTPSFKEANINLSMAENAIANTMANSIKAHMVSDVEVGSFLSSGVDSSFIAASFNGSRAFTVGFDYDEYNEIGYAKELAEQIGLTHHAKTITTEEYWEVLPKLQYHMDEPLADPSAVALYFVSREAAKHVKVALSGEGADEFFGGYNIYREPLDLKAVTSLPMPLRKLLGWLASLLPFNIKGKNYFIRGSKTIEERFIGNANIFSKQEREKILKRDLGASPMEVTAPFYKQSVGKDDVTKMQELDINLWMVGDILLKADKMSMANSLEVRVPFLDKEVFRVASLLPTPLRINRSGTKYAFRRAAARHLPKTNTSRKKLGFPVPIRVWLRNDKYYGIVKEHFTSPAAEKYFNTDALLVLLEQHRQNKKDNSRKIWTVFMFLLWYGEFFDA